MRRSWSGLLAASMFLLALVCLSPMPATAQSTAVMRVDPPTQAVQGGSTFEVSIVQSTAFAPTGAQASLRFDPGLLQVVKVEPGPGYASATFVVGVAPQTTEQAVAEANTSGELKNVTVFILPGTGGGAGAGDNVAFKVTMQAKEFSGTSPIQLVGLIEMLDEQGACYGCAQGDGGQPVAGPVTVQDGSVNISGGGGPPPPGATATATPTGVAGTPTVAIGTITSGGTPGAGVNTVPAGSSGGDISGTTVLMSPNPAEVAKGEEFDLQIQTRSDVPLSSIQLQLSYKPDVMEIVSLTPGPDWANASGASESSLDTVKSQANTAGSIETSFLLSSGENAPAGEGTVLMLHLRANDTDATTLVRFVSLQVTDADGNAVDAEFQDGQIVVGSGGTSASSFMTWMLVSMILLIIAGTGYGSYFMVKRRRRQWAV